MVPFLQNAGHSLEAQLLSEQVPLLYVDPSGYRPWQIPLERQAWPMLQQKLFLADSLHGLSRETLVLGK